MGSMEQNRWSKSAIGLHWLMAILIVVVMTLGWTAEEMPLSPDKVVVFVWHKSVGLTILLLAIVRLLNRLAARSPRHSLSNWERVTSRVVQAGLYLCLLVMPLSGWVINSASDFPLKVFWLVPLPPLTGPSESLAEVAGQVHVTVLYIMLVLMALHVAGALRHYFRGENQVMQAMLPKMERGSADEQG
jgi:cytochrome b561